MKKILPLIALTAAISSGSALAQDDYKWTVGAGVAYLHSALVMDDVQGPFTPPGLKLKAGSVYTPFFSGAYHFNNYFDVEFKGGLPPQFIIRGKGPTKVGSVPYDNATFATLYAATPALMFNATLLNRGAPVRPFVGVGAVYAKFLNIKPTVPGEAVNGGPTTLNLSNSLGFAGQAGLIFRVNDRVSVRTTVFSGVVKTELKTDTSGVQRHANVNVNPIVGIVDVQYAF